MSDYIIEARQVTRTLGRGAREVQALRGIDLSLRRGELTLLMGPSGSGKTTLLLILGCMLAPTSGSVAVCGTSTSGVDKEGLAQDSARPYRLRISVVSSVSDDDGGAERPAGARYPRRARPESSAEGTRGAGSGRTRQKVKSRPGELSGGEQQRVAIARAIVANPSAVLADEPTAALDGENGATVLQMLATTAHERKRAVLVVTHDPRILRFADRIVQIEDGLLVDERADERDRLRLPRAATLPSLGGHAAQ